MGHSMDGGDFSGGLASLTSTTSSVMMVVEELESFECWSMAAYGAAL